MLLVDAPVTRGAQERCVQDKQRRQQQTREPCVALLMHDWMASIADGSADAASAVQQDSRSRCSGNIAGRLS